MAWRLQDNPNLAASIIECPNSFNKSARKAVAIIFVNVTLPKAGEKCISYPVRCDVLATARPHCGNPHRVRIIPYEATHRGARAP